MKRNLKTLGLALMAVFAFSAVVASSAAAVETEGHLTTENQERVTLTGVEIAGTNAFTAFGSEVTCPESTYTGHKYEVTPHVPLTHGDTKVTITPHYKNCNSGGAARTVKMNGCDYEFTDFTTTGGVAGTYGFKVFIKCPVGASIEITGGPCTVKVPSQTITGFHATNDPASGGKPDDITITGTSNGFTSTCSILHTSSAVQHQSVTVTGDNELGQTIGITISD